MSRGELLKAQMNGMLFMLAPSVMSTLASVGKIDVEGIAKNEILYETVNNVAVISIDGAMHKKTQHGLCMSVHGYDTVAKYLSMAETDRAIDTIVFRVDTPGGAVAGADDLEDRIFKSEKKTITLYENLGASAGVYVFSASDEIYATKTTELGSIGVKALIMPPRDGEVVPLEIVSANAENKSCSLDGDCLNRLQSKLDAHEEMFLSTVSKNTGLDKEAIVSGFNNGDTIFAKDALEIGFLNGIKTFHTLLNDVVKGTIPTATSNKIAKKIQGDTMTNEELLAQVEQLTASNEELVAQVASFDATQAEAISVAVESAVRDARAEATSTMVARVQEAFSYGADVDTVVGMLQAEDDRMATKTLWASMKNTEANNGGDGEDGASERTQALMAKAKNFFGGNK